MTNKECWQCKWSGANPKILNAHPYGLALSSLKLASLCPSPELPLFEKKDEKRK